MTTFKVGDKVRRIDGRREHQHFEDVITSISPEGGFIRFNGEPHGFSATRYELVAPAEPTDAELAEQLRSTYKSFSEAREKLQGNGWNVRFLGVSGYEISRNPPREYL